MEKSAAKPSFPITRHSAAILHKALKKAVNDEIFSSEPDDEVEAVRLAMILKELANRRVA